MKTPTIKKETFGIVQFASIAILYFVANAIFLAHIAFPKGEEKPAPPTAAVITPTWVFVVLLLLLAGMVSKKTRKAVIFIVYFGIFLGLSGIFVTSLIPFREPADIQKLSCAAQLLLLYEGFFVFLILVGALAVKKSKDKCKEPPVIENGQG